MRFKTKPKIIIVDDSEVVLTVTRVALERAGYQVVTRNRPTGCVALILQEEPDLVLVDVSMPNVAGDTLVKLFSAASPNSKTIVLLHSSLEEHALQAKAEAAGADGYIKKTSDERKLVQAVDRWLRPAFATRSVTRSRVRPGTTGPPIAGSSGMTSASTDPGTSGMRPPADAGRLPPGSGAERSRLPTVLFVDDDMLALSAYRRQLQAEPVYCEFALSGDHAIRHLSSETPPSAVVSDLLMPPPSGVDVLAAAVQLDASWSQRFVFVSGAPLEEARRQLGSRFYGRLLTKPIDADELCRAIRDCLSRAPGANRAAGQ